jgi:hypothetical protein
MAYKDDFYYLKKNLDINRDSIKIDGSTCEIVNLPFKSKNYKILPGESSYLDQGREFPKTPDYQNAISPEINEILNLADSKVRENKIFRYTIFRPTGTKKSMGALFLFHGLNEKNWDKYLVWARLLTKKTGKAVILFPLAFHMNRAPGDWSDMRIMNDLKNVREGLFPAVVGSSFANVAISTRLHILPQRFFWSGVQTFYDTIQLIEEIRNDNHPCIDKDASIDFFAYSIGAFLMEVLMMDNPKNLLGNSRLFIFCGGPVFNRMTPVRKTILDSEANIALYSFFLEHLENYLKTDTRLAHYFGPTHPEGMIFRSMIDYNKMIGLREEKIKQISPRIKAVALKNDNVVPYYEVLNTLQGTGRDIPVDIQVMDFDYPYTHENPFPLGDKYQSKVNKRIDEIFELAANFLK